MAFCGLLAVLFGCMVWCSYKSLALAIDTIDAAADFMWKTKRIIIVPVLYFFLTVIFVFVWLGAMAGVISMNKITASTILP